MNVVLAADPGAGRQIQRLPRSGQSSVPDIVYSETQSTPQRIRSHSRVARFRGSSSQRSIPQEVHSSSSATARSEIRKSFRFNGVHRRPVGMRRRKPIRQFGEPEREPQHGLDDGGRFRRGQFGRKSARKCREILKSVFGRESYQFRGSNAIGRSLSSHGWRKDIRRKLCLCWNASRL